MATNMAEVLKLAARPTPYDKDERTWLMVRFKLENCLTLVNERYVQLLQDAESQPVANVPAGTDEGSVLIRTVSHTLYALLATLTTGRSLRLVVQRVPNRNGFEGWRRKTHRRLRVEDSQCCKLCCSHGMGERPAKFEEAWNAREQVDVYEELATSKLDDDVKISVALREAPTKLLDNVLVYSQQFESNYSKFRAIIQAHLNTNKNWTASDFRSGTKESDPMEVDNINKGKGKSSGKGKGRSNSKGKSQKQRQ